MDKTFTGYIIALLFLILAFGLKVKDLNEQIATQNEVIQEISSHQHEELDQLSMEIQMILHNQKEELVGHNDYEDRFFNINWQLKALEERVVELQRFHSP